jgi:hypothetical protein
VRACLPHDTLVHNYSFLQRPPSCDKRPDNPPPPPHHYHHRSNADKLKGIVLSALLGAPFVTAVLCVIKRGGEHFFFWLWLLVFAFQIVLLTIYPVAIAPLFNK